MLRDGGKRMKEKDGAWVTVFASGDPGRIAVAKSILEGSGIRYVARNDDVGPALSIYNRSAALVELQVAPADRTSAEEALETLLKG
jgi:hypothetical protein